MSAGGPQQQDDSKRDSGGREATYKNEARSQESASARKRWRTGLRWLVRVGVVLLLVGYLKFVGLDGKFYYPNDEVYLRPEEIDLVYEDVVFRTEDGLLLSGWFLPAQGEPKGIVVHFHGNAANITAHLGLVEWLPRVGYHVLMFDYRGYGKSEGKVTRVGTIRDGKAAVDYAISRPESAGLPLLAYGQSLGGAVAIVVAAERPQVAAVVAESAFSSYRGIASLHAARLLYFEWLGRLVAGLTVSSGHDPIEVVGRIAPRPLLVIAAEDDEICFPELSKELYDAAGEPKSYWLAPGAVHLGITEAHSRELVERMTTFFARAAKACN